MRKIEEEKLRARNFEIEADKQARISEILADQVGNLKKALEAANRSSLNFQALQTKQGSQIQPPSIVPHMADAVMEEKI